MQSPILARKLRRKSDRDKREGESRSVGWEHGGVNPASYPIQSREAGSPGPRRVVLWLRMTRFLSLAILWAAVAGSAIFAQNGGVIPGTTVRAVPSTNEDLPTDPRIAQEGKLPLHVDVRPTDAMTQADRELAGSAAASIRDRAALYELGFNEGDWEESQVECPAFPQHLFLRFTLNRGAGDVSMFAASIPRGKEGRVRVIPILRRGYSLISPAPVSKVAIAAFNQIHAEEHMGGKADWSAVSVCYAALTSERWSETKGAATLGMVGSQTLQLEEHGALSVALELADPASGRWVVTYDRSGQVVKTEYAAFGDLLWRPLPAPLAEVKGKPIPAPQTEVRGQPISTGPEPAGKPVPAPSSRDNPNQPQ